LIVGFCAMYGVLTINRSVLLPARRQRWFRGLPDGRRELRPQGRFRGALHIVELARFGRHTGALPAQIPGPHLGPDALPRAHAPCGLRWGPSVCP